VIAESRDTLPLTLPAGRWEIVDVGVYGFEGWKVHRNIQRFTRALGSIGDEEGGKTVDFREARG
jgi:hypothetical protein